MILPQNIDLNLWAASLVVDFPNSSIPILIDEKQWKEWGDSLVQTSVFYENNAPGTAIYKDWKEWAMAVYFTMSDL